MTNNEERKFVENLKNEYLNDSTKQSKLDELKALDKAVKLPAYIFAYTFGIIGALILGIGMCLAMQIIGFNNEVLTIALGVTIGLIGIVMVSLNYVFYSKILSARKKKYSSIILSKSEELLNK